MNNKEQQMIDACIEEPSLVFKMITLGHFDIVEYLIEDNKINVNLVDSVGRCHKIIKS